jgi:hypothetical protein
MFQDKAVFTILWAADPKERIKGQRNTELPQWLCDFTELHSKPYSSSQNWFSSVSFAVMHKM